MNTTKVTDMTYTEIADEIIRLADGLGYGVDIDFTSRKPIKIITLTRKTKTFSKMEDVLIFLQDQKKILAF